MSPNEIIRPRWSHLEYKWRLDNFWELRALACVEALEDEGGGLIWSQKFGDKERGSWQLKLYPYGDASPAGRGHVSLFLSLDLKSVDVSKAYAIFGCYLLDERGEKVQGSGRSFTRQKFAEGSSSWGWSQFIKVEGQSLNRVLCPPSDSLVVRCDIDVFVGVSATPARNLPEPNSLLDDVKDLIADPEYQDIPIYLADGSTLSANRLVLIARSRYFARQLLASPSSSKFATQVCDSSTTNTTTAPAAVTHSSSSLSPSKTSAKRVANNTNNDQNIDNSNNVRLEISDEPGSTYASFGGLPTDATTPPAPTTSSQPTWEPAEPSISGGAGCVAPANKQHHHVSAGIARTIMRPQEVIELSDPVPIESMKNMLTYMHTDDCPYMSDRTPLRKVLELFTLSRQFEVESLYRALTKKLCASLVSKSTAMAVQEVARRLEVEELEEECRSFLLTCARDLTDEDLLRAIIPNKPSAS